MATRSEDDGRVVTLDNGRVRVEIDPAVGKLRQVTDLISRRDALTKPFELLTGGGPYLLLPGDDGELEFVSAHGPCQVRVGLVADRPVIRLEIRVANRRDVPLPHRPEAPPLVPLPEGDPAPAGFRLGDPILLGPVDTDVWTLHLRAAPTGGVVHHAPGLMARWEDGTLEFWSETAAPRTLVLLGTADGQTLEARVDLYPEAPTRIPFPTLPRALAVERNGLREAMTVDRWVGQFRDASRTSLPVGLDAGELRMAAAVPSLRGAALLTLARLQARTEPALAAETLDRLLLHSGDHPDVWLLRAVLARRMDENDHPALPNLHFLWPLEPGLRAEAFLAGQEGSREGSPLLRPLDARGLLCAALPYWKANLADDATRVIDDALRHQNVPSLRYLAADLLLAQGRLDMEAAAHVEAAETAEGDGPTDPAIKPALLRLDARFPGRARLGRLAHD